MTNKKTVPIRRPKPASNLRANTPTPPPNHKRPPPTDAKLPDEFETYWNKKADQLRERFEQNLCIRTLDSRIKPIALDMIQSYCNSMRSLDQHLADEEVISADYRIAALHAVLTAVNVIQSDLSGVDEP